MYNMLQIDCIDDKLEVSENPNEHTPKVFATFSSMRNVVTLDVKKIVSHYKKFSPLFIILIFLHEFIIHWFGHVLFQDSYLIWEFLWEVKIIRQSPYKYIHWIQTNSFKRENYIFFWRFRRFNEWLNQHGYSSGKEVNVFDR